MIPVRIDQGSEKKKRIEYRGRDASRQQKHKRNRLLALLINHQIQSKLLTPSSPQPYIVIPSAVVSATSVDSITAHKRWEGGGSEIEKNEGIPLPADGFNC